MSSLINILTISGSVSFFLVIIMLTYFWYMSYHFFVVENWTFKYFTVVVLEMLNSPEVLFFAVNSLSKELLMNSILFKTIFENTLLFDAYSHWNIKPAILIVCQWFRSDSQKKAFFGFLKLVLEQSIFSSTSLSYSAIPFPQTFPVVSSQFTG